MPLLSKEQLNKMHSSALNGSLLEKAVDWNDSLLGKSSKGLFNGFSWIGGAIKKGFQKKKINSLVMQWGLEYVKALKAFDLNEPVENKIEDNTEEIIDNSEETSIKLEGDELTDFNNLYTLFSELNDSSKEFNKHFDNSKMINLSSVQEFVGTLMENVNLKSVDIEEKIKSLLIQNPNDKVALQSDIISKILIELGEDINQDSDLYQKLQVVFPKYLDKYVPAVSKQPELKKKMGTLINNAVSTIYTYLNDIKKKSETKKDNNIDYNTSESFLYINEASEFKLPENITDLLPKEDLDKLAQIPDIKQKTFEKINLISLDTILYEVTYIINKIKNNKKSEANADELQRIWDLGIKNINNYFQNVIDVNKVMKSVKSGEVPENIKKSVESTTNAVDMISSLGLIQLSPINASFKDKELYSFNMNILGQNGKKLNNAFLMLSPLAEFKEEGTNTNYFWFKVFGQYVTNEKGQIQRLNPFKGLTNNSSMIKNFDNEENTYIICFESLKVSNKLSKMWIYSNKGSLFYDGKIINDFNNIIEDIKKFSQQEWLKIGNIVRYTMNSRLNAGKDNINRFPGIQNADLVNEKNVNIARKNHDGIINNLQK